MSKTCTSAQTYLSPTSGQKLDSLDTVPISWDNDCIDPSAKLVDIYVYAPSLSTPLIQQFVNVPVVGESTNATYQANFKPKWWNNAASIDIKLLIVPSGQPSWSGGAQSAAFSLTYDAQEASSRAEAEAGTAIDATGSNDKKTYVNKTGDDGSKLSSGAIAAAVVVPLLALIALIIAYVIYRRRKIGRKRQRWSQHMDERRQTRVLSTFDTAGGPFASPDGKGLVNRHSMARSSFVDAGAPEWRPRASMISTGDRNTRTSSWFGRSSVIGGEGLNRASVWSQSTNQAGVGARRLQALNADPDGRNSALYDTPSRNSRTVSFHDQTHLTPTASPSHLRPDSAYSNSPLGHQPSDYRPIIQSPATAAASPSSRALLTPGEYSPRSPRLHDSPSEPHPYAQTYHAPSDGHMTEHDDGSQQMHAYSSPDHYASSAPGPAHDPSDSLSPDAAMKAYAATRQNSVRQVTRNGTVGSTSQTGHSPHEGMRTAY